jgi:cytochrome c-type biogenesis protein CcmH/NrfF
VPLPVPSLVASLVAALTVNPPALPQTPVAESGIDTVAAQDVTEVDRFLGTVMSPFCPGLTLATCPSAAAETLRASVRARLAAGESPDSITESLVAAFGEEVRGAPRARGLGLALWVLPMLALGGGGIGLVWWLRNRSVGTRLPAHGGLAGPPPEPPPEDRARLEVAQRELE